MKINRKGSLLMGVGAVMIVAAVLLGGYNLWDEARATQAADTAVAQITATRKDREENATPEPAVYELNPGMEMPVETVEEWDYIGTVEFPERGVMLPVISAWSYPALKVSPCRYEGSAYAGDLILSAHNYRSHFGCLKDLVIGEQVRFTDMEGNVFRYSVVEHETLMPTDIEGMKAGDWDLTLFTCTLGGEKRVTVRCLMDDAH